MKALPRIVADVEPVHRLHMEIRLQLIEEFAQGSQEAGTGAPGRGGAIWGLIESLGRDWKTDVDAIAECHRGEVREWWQEFPERELLTALYRRAFRRRAGCGSPDSRRPPSHREGVRLATALLVGIPDTSRLDSEQDSVAVSNVLAALLSPPLGVRSRAGLRQYIRRSKSSRVHFDALERICEELNSRGDGIPPQLFRWRQGVLSGHRRRPRRKRVQSHRPINPDTLQRDVHIRFTLEVMQRVGVPPMGRTVSGCRIVSEVLRLSEGTVRRIWMERKKPLPFVMRKHSKAVAARVGLFPSD